MFPMNLCPCRVHCDDFRGSMKRAFCLVEVDGAGYVRGDCGFLVTRFGDRVYLDGERYRNINLPQLTCECDCLRSTPTVPVDDDGRLFFLDGREDAIVVGIEEAHDLMKGLSAMVIAEHFYMDGGVTVAKICGELHFGVLCVIATDESLQQTR